MRNFRRRWQKAPELTEGWSCGRSKSIPINARIYVIKQGDPPRGIFAAGLTASHSEELSHLYNYSSASGCSVPIAHILSHQHDKRVYNNASLLKPSIIIESNPLLGIDPVRIGFACTDVRPGDFLCQFSGLDITPIARRVGSSHELQLIGLAKMVTHSSLQEKGIHPSCNKHEHGSFSGVVQEETTNGNAEGWTMVTDPISLWEMLRRS